MADRLSRRERLDIVADLCPGRGVRRACDSSELAAAAAADILGRPRRAQMTADYVLMTAIDRFAGGRLTLADLYRCRVLAYYMTFADGGEEWERWGVAADVRPGGFPAPPEEPDAEPAFDTPPDGPPWGIR